MADAALGCEIRRRQALEVLRAWQAEERAAARDRLAGLAAILDEPTALRHSVGPLLTPAQRGRSHPGSRP